MLVCVCVCVCVCLSVCALMYWCARTWEDCPEEYLCVCACVCVCTCICGYGRYIRKLTRAAHNIANVDITLMTGTYVVSAVSVGCYTPVRLLCEPVQSALHPPPSFTDPLNSPLPQLTDPQASFTNNLFTFAGKLLFLEE